MNISCHRYTCWLCSQVAIGNVIRSALNDQHLLISYIFQVHFVCGAGKFGRSIIPCILQISSGKWWVKTWEFSYFKRSTFWKMKLYFIITPVETLGFERWLNKYGWRALSKLCTSAKPLINRLLQMVSFARWLNQWMWLSVRNIYQSFTNLSALVYNHVVSRRFGNWHAKQISNVSGEYNWQ